MTLSEKISYLRKRDGVSQEELAELLSVSRQSIYKWESGECLPGWEKIKNIAKIFNVSFDFLMDDSVEKTASNAEPGRAQSVQRHVFFTGTKLTRDQINIDNGYTSTRKATMRHSHLKANIDRAVNELRLLNITDIFQVQPGSATFFFYDSANHTCGFFYAGMVQFVCPIENILGFTYGGGNHKIINSTVTVGSFGFGSNGLNSIGVGRLPTVTALPDTNAWAAFSYKNGDSVEQFEIDFSVDNLFFSNQVCKSSKDFAFFVSVEMDRLLKNLEKLQLKISSLFNIGQDIKNGNVKANKLDYDAIIKANGLLKARYDAYLSAIEDEANRDNRKRLITRVAVFLSLGVLAIIVIDFLKNM